MRPVDIFDGVVHNLMRVVRRQPLVGEQGVSVEGRASFDVLLHFGLESGLLSVGNHGSADLAATLKNAHDGNLIFGAGASDAAGLLRKMHIAGLTADERLIRFNFARELDRRVLVHGGANAVEHMPRGFLGDADGAGEFARANTVLAVSEKPVSAHPLIETESGVLKDRSDLQAELLFAPIALPYAPGFNEGVLLGAATRARDNTIRPAKIQGALKGAVTIAEVNDGFLKGVRCLVPGLDGLD